MSKISIIKSSLFILLAASSALSQQAEFHYNINPFPVRNATGMASAQPFLGGFNRPHPQFADFDSDGDLDLFVQEASNDIIFIENTGSLTAPQFEWRSAQFQNLSVGAWFKMADLDADGDPDLYCESPAGMIRIYRNDGAQFVLAADSLRDDAGNLILTEVPSIPEMADIDCDGDLDLFLTTAAGLVVFYRNTAPNGSDLPVFTFITDQFEDIRFVEGGKRAQPPATGNVSRHGSSTVAVVDIDHDGDSDMFWGEFFNRGLRFLKNSGDCSDPQIALTADTYPPQNTLLTGGFNTPQFVDFDGNGTLDLFAGALGGAFNLPIDAVENFYFYRNHGSPEQPDFALESLRFIDMPDVGKNSMLAAADIDDDGDLDLFVSNEADSANNSSGNGKVYFYENTGTATAPDFMLKNTDFLDADIGFSPAPAFVDIDDDGDLDVFAGEFFGSLNFFRNIGNAQAPQLQLEASKFGNIDVGNNSLPTFADIDADGDFDLFVGDFLGNIEFYRNDGTAGNARFVLDTTRYFGISVTSHAAPAFADADGDGDLDLYVGSGDGALHFYRNDGSKDQANFVQDTELELAMLPRNTPVLADFDGDGDADIMAGNARGGLTYFENLAVSTSILEQKSVPGDFMLEQNYPNPFNPTTVIKYQLQRISNVELTIFNPIGQRVATLIEAVKSAGQHKVTWYGRDDQNRPVASGVYLYRLRVGKAVQVRKMLLMR